jgi:hypothetical protein
LSQSTYATEDEILAVVEPAALGVGGEPIAWQAR